MSATADETAYCWGCDQYLQLGEFLTHDCPGRDDRGEMVVWRTLLATALMALLGVLLALFVNGGAL